MNSSISSVEILLDFRGLIVPNIISVGIYRITRDVQQKHSKQKSLQMKNKIFSGIVKMHVMNLQGITYRIGYTG